MIRCITLFGAGLAFLLIAGVTHGQGIIKKGTGSSPSPAPKLPPPLIKNNTPPPPIAPPPVIKFLNQNPTTNNQGTSPTTNPMGITGNKLILPKNNNTPLPLNTANNNPANQAQNLKLGKINNGNSPFKRIIPGVAIVLLPVPLPVRNQGGQVIQVTGDPGVPVEPAPAPPVEPAPAPPVDPATVAQTTQKPAAEPADPVGVVPVQQSDKEYGLRIVELDPGPAQKAGLKLGDVILAVGDYRTQNYEDLRQLVQAAKGPFVVTYWSAAANKMSSVTVVPEEKRIGVAILPIEIE